MRLHWATTAPEGHAPAPPLASHGAPEGATMLAFRGLGKNQQLNAHFEFEGWFCVETGSHSPEGVS